MTNTPNRTSSSCVASGRDWMVSCLAALTLVAACHGSRAASDSGAAASMPEMEQLPKPQDSISVRFAEAALERFLDLSRDGYAGPRVMWDTIVGCNPPAEPSFPLLMLARGKVLSSAMRGDTVVTQAEVLSVAAQERDPRRRDRYYASQRVQRDTMEWDVVPDARSGRWLVCNGLRFGFVGPDSLTTWSSADESLFRARALAAMLYQSEH
jgi:hypothetical protein